MDVTDHKRKRQAQVPERRRVERRARMLRGLMYGGFRPRRRGPRRAGERGLERVDWHHPQWLAVAMLIVLFSCVDALLDPDARSSAASRARSTRSWRRWWGARGWRSRW